MQNNYTHSNNLEENKLCDFYKYVNQVDMKRATYVIKNLKPAFGFKENKSVNLNNLLSFEDKVLEISNNEIEIFFSMLLKSDLLEGISSNKINLEEALNLADLPIEKGKKNSIYYITREIMKNGLNDKNAFLMTQNIFVYLPILKYTSVISIVNRFINSQSNHNSINQAFLWSENILRNNIHFSKYDYSDYLYRMAAEFYMARSIYTNAYKKINGIYKENDLTRATYNQSSSNQESIFDAKTENCENHIDIVFNKILNTMKILENIY